MKVDFFEDLEKVKANESAPIVEEKELQTNEPPAEPDEKDVEISELLEQVKLLREQIEMIKIDQNKKEEQVDDN